MYKFILNKVSVYLVFLAVSLVLLTAIPFAVETEKSLRSIVHNEQAVLNSELAGQYKPQKHDDQHRQVHESHVVKQVSFLEHKLSVTKPHAQEKKPVDRFASTEIKPTQSETTNLITFAKPKVIKISNFPVKMGYLSSRFGMRKDPIHGHRRMHEGLDIAAPVGSNIYPMGDGNVIYSGYKAGYGKTIIIKHGRTVITQYSHLKDILINPGQDVSKNTVIGLVGNSGRSTGPHLHLEVTLSGQKVDPATFLAGIVASKIEVASKSKIISSAAPVIPVKLEKVTYQDYLQSFDGLYGLRAPDRTN